MPPARLTPSLLELRLGINVRRGLTIEYPMTQDQVATLAGVTQAHVSGLENGAHNASEQMLAKLARIYGLDRDIVRAAMGETQRRLRLGIPQRKPRHLS